MKLDIIKQGKKQYKTEMHCHTNCSDGQFSPEEIKDLYLKRGYSAVLFSDHDVFVTHNELTDENFVALNGYELFVPSLSDNPYEAVGKQAHLNFIALSPKKKKMLFYNPDYIYTYNGKKYIDKIPTNGNKNETRYFTPEWINYAIKKANANGFAVSFNHPVWSCAQPEDYLNLNGLFAIEVWNSPQEDGGAFREMVYKGKEIFAIAANDFHKFRDGENSILACIYIQANKLTYNSLISNLLAGNYYSSCGPTITELSIENDVLHISCSKVKCIQLVSLTINFKSKQEQEGELFGADFTLKAEEKNFFYLVLTDENGNKAWTNPIFNYGKRIFNIVSEKNNYESIFLFDKYYPFNQSELAKLKVPSTYFTKRDIVEQIDELLEYINETPAKNIFVQFSQSDVLSFDILYYLGEKAVKQMQKDKLTLIEEKLNNLKHQISKDKKLILFSLLPMAHSANCYDYRNNYVRKINTLLSKFCKDTNNKFVNLYQEYQDNTGKLDCKFYDYKKMTDDIISKIVSP